MTCKCDYLKLSNDTELIIKYNNIISITIKIKNYHGYTLNYYSHFPNDNSLWGTFFKLYLKTLDEKTLIKRLHYLYSHSRLMGSFILIREYYNLSLNDAKKKMCDLLKLYY